MPGSIFGDPETYIPCPDCGNQVYRPDKCRHICEVRIKLYQGMRELLDDIPEFFDSPAGKFEMYYAERERLKPPSDIGPAN